MNYKISNKITLLIITFIIFTISVPASCGYPPDNAAVLYYRAFMLYQPDDTMADMLSKFAKGNIEVNEKIKEFLNRRDIQRIIKTSMDASQVIYCDWGMDLSDGWEVEMPNFSSLRKLTFLILANARFLAEQGDSKTALLQCVAVKKMANHCGDVTFVPFTVCLAMNVYSNKVIRDILSNIDVSTLNWLKEELKLIQTTKPKTEMAFNYEKEIVLIEFTGQKLEEKLKNDMIKGLTNDPKEQQKLREISKDPKLLERNLEYYKRYMNRMIESCKLPYPKGYEQFKAVENNLRNDANSNPEAVLGNTLLSAFSSIYLMDLRVKADENALTCAVDIFIENAKDKKLPDLLQPTSPNDPFSHKPFIYEKTPNEFILKCDEKNLPEEAKEDIDKYEYKFKLKK